MREKVDSSSSTQSFSALFREFNVFFLWKWLFSSKSQVGFNLRSLLNCHLLSFVSGLEMLSFRIVNGWKISVFSFKSQYVDFAPQEHWNLLWKCLIHWHNVFFPISSPRGTWSGPESLFGSHNQILYQLVTLDFEILPLGIRSQETKWKCKRDLGLKLTRVLLPMKNDSIVTCCQAYFRLLLDLVSLFSIKKDTRATVK